MVVKTKIQQSSLALSQLTSLKCNAWTLIIIANMTAESLNFWLIKFVLLILWKSKLTECEIIVETTLNMHLKFVVSVAC